MKTFLRYLALSCLFSFSVFTSVHADEMLMARVPQDFPEAMLKLQELIKKQGYTVSRVQRIDIGLTKSGYKTDNYRVVFYGKSDEISHISQRFPELIPYLPLKIAIFAEAGDTMLVAANPVFLAANAAKDLKQQLLIWEKDLQKLLVEMKSGAE